MASWSGKGLSGGAVAGGVAAVAVIIVSYFGLQRFQTDGEVPEANTATPEEVAQPISGGEEAPAAESAGTSVIEESAAEEQTSVTESEVESGAAPEEMAEDAPAATLPTAEETVVAALPETPPEDAPETSAAPPASTAPESEDLVEAPEATSAEPEPVAEAPAPEAAPAPPAPTFDVVRVDPEGGTLVAGTGLEGATVTVMIDGTKVAETTTANGGKFVALFDITPSDQPKILTLMMTLPDGRVLPSEQSVIVAPRPVVVAEADPNVAPEPEAEFAAATGADTDESGASEIASATPSEGTPAPDGSAGEATAETMAAVSDAQPATAATAATSEGTQRAPVPSNW